ncbi:MAG: hypothetical protein HOQ05_13735 [Corynebacteriales bacterium]|nr:hypothetical protein [Mycobacteriales bacterium]
MTQLVNVLLESCDPPIENLGVFHFLRYAHSEIIGDVMTYRTRMQRRPNADKPTTLTAIGVVLGSTAVVIGSLNTDVSGVRDHGPATTTNVPAIPSNARPNAHISR